MVTASQRFVVESFQTFNDGEGLRGLPQTTNYPKQGRWGPSLPWKEGTCGQET